MKSINISVIFSFRNEEENIKELVRRVDESIRTIAGVVYEVVFVNDDSTDNSLALLLELQEKYPIVIINMSRKFGVTPCVIAGIAQSKGDAVVYLDADLQDPPELIPVMYKKFLEGYDVVHTTRTTRRGEGRVKLLLTKLAYKAINLLSDIPLEENTGDFKLISRRAAEEILKINEYDPFMRGLSVWVGYRQFYLKYERDPRFSGETKFPMFSSGPAKEFIRGVTSNSAVPLYLSLYLGILVLIFGFFSIIYALVTKALGISAPGSSSILIALSIFGGAIMIGNGIMGIYIAKIFHQLKGRPRYIVSEIIERPNDR